MKESRRQTLKYLPESVTRDEVLELIGARNSSKDIARRVLKMATLVLADLFALSVLLIFVPWPLALMLAAAGLMWGINKWY